MTPNRTQAPSVEPVTVAGVKTHTRIDSTAEDALLSVWIRSARELAETSLRRSLITQKWQLWLDAWPRMPLHLPRSPVQSVDAVKYYGTDDTEYSLELSGLVVDTNRVPGRITTAWGEVLPTTTLRPMASVLIETTNGYGDSGDDVPACIRDAIMVYVAYRYDNRAAESTAAPPHFYDLLAQAGPLFV